MYTKEDKQRNGKNRAVANSPVQGKNLVNSQSDIVDKRSLLNPMNEIKNVSQRAVIQRVRVEIGMDLDEILRGTKIQQLKNLLCTTYGGTNLSHGAHGSSADQQYTVRETINDYLDSRSGTARTTAATAINTAWGVTEFS